MAYTPNKTKRLYADLPIIREARTWAEIQISALRHNYQAVLGHVNATAEGKPPTLIGVVKADAYGHGAGSVVRTLLDEGCRFFAVSCIEEALEVRAVCEQTGIAADVLILGYTRPSLAVTLAQENLIATLPSLEHAVELAEQAQKYGVRVRAHVKLDTGMNRLGFPAHTPEEIDQTAQDILALFNRSTLQIEGMFTHFARADEDADTIASGLTKQQTDRFFAVRSALDAAGAPPLFCHLNNSAAALHLPSSMADGVRVGISLYGYPPSDVLNTLPLRPVMRFCTMVSQLHTLKKGESVSYGGTYTAKEDRQIATLPVGYADGFIRDYSGASVRIATASGEISAPIIGRICMDQCMVDVTDTDVRVGDTVTLFGQQPQDVEDLARRADTIPYEVLCLVSARVPRRYV